MLDLFFAAFGALWRSMETDARRRAHAERMPHEREVVAFTRALSAWTSRHGLVQESPPAPWTGTLGRVRVSVRSGLGGSRPGGLEVEMDVAHEDSAPHLVTRESENETPLARALARVLGDPELTSLRSIAIVPNKLRARLAPLSPPSDVDAVVDACAAAAESLRTHAVPYR